MRLSRDGGRNYFTSNERPLTRALPSVPAAVRICGTDGMIGTICLDLDTSRGTGDVGRDHATVTAWFTRHGARWIEDRSPNGGRHLYLPLARRVGFTEARHFVEALARRLPTLDPAPHQNAEAGCIRTPGSVHKRGGYQQLTMPLAAAYDIAQRRNPAPIWERLTRDLAADIAAVSQRAGAQLRLIDENSEFLPLSGGPRNLPLDKERIARSGAYNPARYGSPSEARQAVLASAAAAGWQLTDVARLMKQNTWAGMVTFYARYSPTHRGTALRRDWTNAVRYVQDMRRKNTPTAEAKNTDRKSYTSPTNTQGGTPTPSPGSGLSEHQFLRSWRNVLSHYEATLTGSRSGLLARLVLRALGEAAIKRGDRFIEFGARSLAIGAGSHPTSVARQLRQLAALPHALIRLAQEAHGTRADLYELIIPVDYQHIADTRTWPKGRLHALRPVFRELGPTAAFVYEAIEMNDGDLTSAEVARASVLSPSSVNTALETLAAWNMISRSNGRWTVVAATSLRQLAERFGVMETIGHQLARYRRERQAWRQWLETRESAKVHLLSPSDSYPFWLYEGPPDDDTTMVHFIQQSA
ncbi:MAG: hypothetical protein JWP57_4486 [Spirosoma sp.]|nr:hypothetical protein [Spirosoma sp.]